MTKIAALAASALAALLLVAAADLPEGVRPDGWSDVVVVLDSPPLARAPGAERAIAREQRAFLRELRADVPDARVGWRYRLVANGFSVALPRAEVRHVRSLSGVRAVLPAATYAPQADSTPPQIGAPGLWGPSLDTAGQGIKIGIIDSGVDPAHPYFDPTGYTMPPGFPKGQTRFTTAKVIVARSFPPRGDDEPAARLAFTGEDNPHGTHVAGIAAGNPNTSAGRQTLSGVAPRAYIGNYKVFVPTPSGLSPNANSPAIVAAIEAAVADGMDVINFSGGEPELEPSRDIVAQALDAAAAAGVVPVVAAGNEYAEVGGGSVSSPANAPDAIAVGAVSIGGTPVRLEHADFSSVGPTTISLRLKPDVAAPGVGVLSSVPGGWATADGTSMASPHVAGAAALLVQRHPDWKVAQVKSALVQSGVDETNANGRPLGPLFQGGGVVALGRADAPLLFADPTSISFGLLERGTSATASIALEDADGAGGAGTWRVSKLLRDTTPGASITVPATVEVPGTLEVDVTVSAGAAGGDVDGYVVLRRGNDVRRVPIWGRVTPAALARHQPLRLPRPGLFRGTTAGQPAFVTRYRYPEFPRRIGVTTFLRGPERVYTIRIAKPVANFGVVVTSRAPGSDVEPRVVSGLDENRLTGYAALPTVSNPYLDEYHDRVPASGALAPRPGAYAVAFDSGTRGGAGRFTFRFWINDVTRPTVRLRTRSVSSGSDVRVAASDAGSGIYRGSIETRIDGKDARARFEDGVISISTQGLAPGTHRLWIRVSDYQETKNTENVGPILPNTRALSTSFRVR